MNEVPISVSETEVSLASGQVNLAGVLSVPERASGVVLFAHGSGSGRASPRNRHVAGALHSQGLATLLVDLLTEEESRYREFVFDLDLLSRRLLACTAWLGGAPATRDLDVGYFGASTGAGAALQAAALVPEPVKAVVSRGGRPDLAAPYLARVKAPTLFIVGGADEVVLRLNREALAALAATKDLVVVPGATHLFEEPGALEAVAAHAAGWFARFLGRSGD